MVRLGRGALFGAISAAAVVFGIAAYRTVGSQMDGVWGELFWLTLAVLLTSFLVESLLGRDTARRRRLEDGFAFRTFAATLLDRLLEVAGMEAGTPSPIVAAAVRSPAEFATQAARAASEIQSAVSVSPDPYHRHYLDVQYGLKDLGRGYIRIFATTRDEMVTLYLDLLDVAQRWEYLEAFSPTIREHAQSAKLHHDQEMIARYEAQETASQKAALQLLRDTAAMLANLAQRATGNGMPAP